MGADNHTLILDIHFLSQDDCNLLVNEITKILKENKVMTYQIKFGTSVNAGFDD